MKIAADTLAALMQGYFTCYWCGELADGDHIADHVDNCLREIRWLREHVSEAKGTRA